MILQGKKIFKSFFLSDKHKVNKNLPKYNISTDGEIIFILFLSEDGHISILNRVSFFKIA